MESYSLVQAFLSALEAGSQVSALLFLQCLHQNVILQKDFGFFWWSSWPVGVSASGTGVKWHSPQHSVVDLCIYS